MEEKLQIRRYEDSDHEEVISLHQTGLEQTGTDLGPGPWNDDMTDINNHYINNNGDFIVGLSGGKLVAMGAFRKVSSIRAEVKRIRVNPDHQRCGFGEQIMTELERRAARLGYEEICLDTTTLQIPAQKMFEKLGYLYIRHEKFQGLDVLMYEKPINK
jgi:ribosomal protein S18 acetylase RimI-like enzyme